MALTTATISGRITDLLRSGGVKATVSLSPVAAAGSAPPDPTGNLLIGPEMIETNDDGTLSLSLPKLPQAGFEDCHWRATITTGGRRESLSVMFDLTRDMTWAQVAEYAVFAHPITALASTGDGTGNVTSEELNAGLDMVRSEVPSNEGLVIVAAPRWRSAMSPNGVTVDLPASSAHATLLVAPFPLTILSANIEWSAGQAADALNYWTLTLRKAEAGTTSGTDIAAFTTAAGLAAMTPKDWRNLVDPARQLTIGQRLIIAAARSTTRSPNLGAATVTLRYAPA